MIPSPPQAVRRQGRRRLAAAGLVVVAAVGIGLVTWHRVGSGDVQAASVDGMSAAAEWSPGVGPYGITLGAEVSFDDDRVLTRGRILVDTTGPAPYVSFTPRDGTDEDAGYPLPRGLDGGVTVAVEVTVLPTCGVEVTAPPVFEIDSRPDDGVLTAVHTLLSEPRTDTALAADLPAWQRAVNEWCAGGVHAHTGEGTTTLAGGVIQTLTLYNPGPDPVTVVCAAQRDGSVRWEHAEVTVAGGTVGKLTVRGDQADLKLLPPLTANGEPLRVLNS